jgi:hypothetical protein
MKLFVLGGSGGGVNYVAYDAKTKEAEMSTARTKIRDEVTTRAYKAALEADVYRDQNIEALNEGLGFLTKYLDAQIDGAKQQTDISDKANTEGIPAFQEKATRTATAVTDSLMEYINGTSSDTYGGY